MNAVVRDPRSKGRHLEVCLHEAVEYRKTTGLERYEFVNEAMPELALGDVDLSCVLAGKPLRAPLMISPMTGGTERGREINRKLASAAERHGLAFGVGSQRLALEQPDREIFYRVRDVAPRALVFANFGAAQLARGYDASHARRAITMIGADALFVHFNALQEVLQDRDASFLGIARAFERLCREMTAEGIPVFAREVCFGMTAATVTRLVDCGASGIDCSGAGGTSWARVEAYCATSQRGRELGERFGEWGIATSQSILNVRAASASIPLIASGGLRNGIDLAKALALGADVGAMARPLLLRAHEGEASLEQFIVGTLEELRICMFATGSRTVADLRGKLVPMSPEMNGGPGGGGR